MLTAKYYKNVLQALMGYANTFEWTKDKRSMDEANFILNLITETRFFLDVNAPLDGCYLIDIVAFEDEMRLALDQASEFVLTIFNEDAADDKRTRLDGY
jgi:hypothetical protein